LNPYEIYQQALRDRAECQRWAALIGKQSNATAPHRGAITGVSGHFAIHFQPSDGATNYHDSPKIFDAVLADVMKDHSKMLIEETLAVFVRRENDALVKCKSFAEAMLKEISDLESPSL